jgi:hypothetical protein
MGVLRWLHFLATWYGKRGCGGRVYCRLNQLILAAEFGMLLVSQLTEPKHVHLGKNYTASSAMFWPPTRTCASIELT